MLSCTPLTCQGMENENNLHWSWAAAHRGAEERLSMASPWGRCTHMFCIPHLTVHPLSLLSWPQGHTVKCCFQHQHITGQTTGDVGEPMPCLCSSYQRRWPLTDFPGSIFAPCDLQHLLGHTRTAKKILSKHLVKVSVLHPRAWQSQP